MTSEINVEGIQEGYPFPGQDNNSQGFRDNFTYIKIALEQAAGEISDLQSKVLLKEPLEGDITVDNDLLGNTIYNAIYAEFYGKVYGPVNTNGTVNVTLIDGPYQAFVAIANTTLRFEDWPEEGYAKITLELKGNQESEYTVTFSTEAGGSVKKESGFPDPFILPATDSIRFVEAWTRDGGSTVYLKYVGDW